MTISTRSAVSALFFLNGLTYGTWVAQLPLLKVRLALGNGALGIALLFAAIASLATLPLAGAWIAQRGSHGIAIVASLAAMPTLVFPYLAPNYATLLAATFALGIAYSAMDVAMNAQAVLVEAEVCRPIMSSFHGVFSIGGLGGAIVTAGALAAGRAALEIASTVALVAECALVVAVFFIAKDRIDRRGSFANGVGVGSSEKRPRRRTLVAKVALLGALAFFGLVGEGAMADWSAIYLRTSLFTNVATAAVGFGAFSVAMALGRFAGDAIVARIGRIATLVAGAMLATGGLVFLLVVHAVWASFVGFAFVGLGLANVIPVTFSIAGRMRGLDAGVGIAGVSTVGYAGFLIGPPVIGFVSDAVGLRLALGIVALGIAAIAFLAPRIDDGTIATLA